MAFQKYEVEASPSTDVKVGKLGITVTKAALNRLQLGDVDYVNLYWDADGRKIGISASSGEDKSAFKIGPRGRSGRDKFIGARKFYDRFGLTINGSTPTSGGLADHDGIAAFTLNLPKTDLPKPPYTGKPRGRRRKVVVEAAE
jgi:hypothetical protein